MNRSSETPGYNFPLNAKASSVFEYPHIFTPGEFEDRWQALETHLHHHGQHRSWLEALEGFEKTARTTLIAPPGDSLSAFIAARADQLKIHVITVSKASEAIGCLHLTRVGSTLEVELRAKTNTLHTRMFS